VIIEMDQLRVVARLAGTLDGPLREEKGVAVSTGARAKGEDLQAGLRGAASGSGSDQWTEFGSSSRRSSAACTLARTVR
jgi:hypothetical protein